jgi:photosystem II stability/assembly factor-like uncharacterized protein
VAPYHDDAALRDVTFVDPQWGWAVGDHGVIWHTQDGGATWRRQSAPTAETLRGVSFVDRRHGMVVGGAREPDDGRGTSRGVVLVTYDGGAEWRRLPSGLPRLEQVRCFTRDEALLVGRGNAARPAGVWRTDDGGRNWQPAGDGPLRHWLACDALDADNGVLVGVGGHLAELAAGTWRDAGSGDARLRNLRGVALVRARLVDDPAAPPVSGWIVGDAGMLAATRDWGRTWQAVDALPAALLQSVDLLAVATAGTNVWTAGSPGSQVLHSADGGATWVRQPTGVTTPLRKLCFVDEQHGWAVGDLGVVLATDDGGATWQVQRGAGRRAAVLGLFADAKGLPYHTLAQLAADEGYRTAVRLLADEHAAVEPDDDDVATRLEDALTRLGGHASSVAGEFAGPPERLRYDAAAWRERLERRHAGAAEARVLADMVRQIRLWRPDVALLPAADAPCMHPLDPWLHALALEALRAAADPAFDAPWNACWSLPPWSIRRGLAYLPADAGRGSHHVPLAEPSRRLGQPLVQLAAAGRRLAVPAFPPAEQAATEEFRLVWGDGAGRPDDFLSDLNVTAGGPARRTWEAFEGTVAVRTRQLALQRRNLLATMQARPDDEATIGQIAQTATQLDAAGGASLLDELAQSLLHAGDLRRVAQVRELLLQRYPQDPSSLEAAEWLVQFYASREAAWAFGDAERIDEAIDDAGPDGSATSPTPPGGAPPPVRGPLGRRERLARATTLANFLAQRSPLHYELPTLRFPAAAAAAALGDKAAQLYWTTQAQRDPAWPWQAAAATQLQLRDPEQRRLGPPPAVCRRAAERPTLDAVYDEPFWEHADALRLQSRTAEPGLAQPSTVRWAYDDQYLYVAIACPLAPGQTYAPDERPRPQDADLTAFDRVRLALDLDGDYVSWFELEVDYRGFLADRCWRSAAWNPQWFVAARIVASAAADDGESVGASGGEWQVEAAIPWTALAPAAPALGEAWSVAIERITPGVGFQTLNGRPAATPRPENFGVLRFE